jgi:hypothetical protein
LSERIVFSLSGGGPGSGQRSEKLYVRRFQEGGVVRVAKGAATRRHVWESAKDSN